MSYEVLEKQIRALPEEALNDVSFYLDKIGSIYLAKKLIDFLFVGNFFETLSDAEADELRSCCGMKFKENAVLVTNNTKHFQNLNNIQLVNWINQKIPA